MFDSIVNILEKTFIVIGLATTLFATFSKIVKIKTLSWKDITKYCKNLIRKMEQDGYSPDIIISIGRSGAIVGAILSTNLKYKPYDANILLLGCDRTFTWEEGLRISQSIECIEFKDLSLKKVLIVCGDSSTGKTLELLSREIKKHNPIDIKTAVLIKLASTIYHPNYSGKTLSSDFLMPWVFKSKNYRRDGRSPL